MSTLRLPAVLLAVVFALAFTACGDDDDGGGGGGGGGGGATADAEQVGAANPTGDVTWCIGKDTSGAFNTVVDNFNEANPEANVELLELPTSADDQRRLQIQRLRAESPQCDVLGMDVIWTAEYAAQGWLLDMTEAVEQQGDAFIPSTLETAKYEDKYWAFPFNTNAGFIYWRTDQAGDQPPDTWEAVYQQGRQDDGFIYQGARYEGLTVNFLELLYSAGGNVVNEDGSEATADSEEVRNVLEFMRKGVDDGAVPKAVTTYMEEESRRAFESGRATFMRNWPYAYALGKESEIADDFEVTTFPSYQGNPGAGVLGGYNLAISAYSENPEGSRAFIEFATEPEQQVIQATEASLPAVVSDVYDNPRVIREAPFARELRDAVEQAKPRPVSPVYPQISEAIYNNVYAALQGDKSPDQAAQDMNDDIQQALETF
ncbi:MAG TPA: ABC transporter substrate-binding protein [Thermoleophilaceae bacterium]|nr:ABC transporter substrate-binding protein [Thermoleophilaceae bacterium]